MYKVWIIAGLALLSLHTQGQTGNSPYSSLGVGDVYSGATITNSGMGHVGVGTFSNLHVNYLNPALLSHTTWTSFEFSVWGEYKQLKKEGISQRQATGNLNQIILSLPILTNRYVIAMGMRPLSLVNYSSAYSKNLNSSDVANYTMNGSGGLNTLFLSQGIKLSSHILIGLQGSYIFGTIRKSGSVTSKPMIGGYTVESVQESNYRGFSVKPGLSFESKLKKDIAMVIGLTSELTTPLTVKDNFFGQHKDAVGNIITSDTLLKEKTTALSYPQNISAGISLYKGSQWLIGGDFSFQDWSSFKNLSNDILTTSYTIGIGGEMTPNAGSTTYLNRVTYRTGIQVKKTPFIVNGESIYDYQFTLGASLPVTRLSYINLALNVGQRGIAKDALIQEQYIRFIVGVSFNDRWFVRRKYD